jgi:hypothetical protein
MESKIEVKPIGIDKITLMTQVHLSAFSNSLLTRLGFDVVSKYYEWQFTDIIKYKKKIFALGVFYGDEMAAFIIFGISRNAKIGFLKKNWAFLIFKVLSKIGKFKINEIIEIMSNFNYLIKKIRVKNNLYVQERINEKESFGILVIACKIEFQGRGFGTLLMRNAEKIAKKNESLSIRLSVRDSNENAQKIYEALGYVKVLDINGNWLGNSMIKIF